MSLKRPRAICSACGLEGHYASKCPTSTASSSLSAHASSAAAPKKPTLPGASFMSAQSTGQQRKKAKKDHILNQDPSTYFAGLEQHTHKVLKCHKCGQTGHTSRRCTMKYAKDDDTSSESTRWGNPASSVASKLAEAEAAETPTVQLKPDYKTSGLLLADASSKTKTGEAAKGPLKYAEPIDARVPVAGKWRLYIFAQSDAKPRILPLELQSCFLMGKETETVFIKDTHPSVSSQHAAIQFRQKVKKDGVTTIIKPYLIDLESTNGTTRNTTKIDAARFHELRANDVIRLAQSPVEYVLIKVKKEKDDATK